MSYLPADAPLPDWDPWETRFWDFCRKRSLRFQQCGACGVVRHPPMPVCGACHSLEEEWVEAGDDAELFTYTIVHHASHASLQPAVPYNAGVVIFRSLRSVRLVSNIVDCPNENLRIGMKLSLVWEEPQPGRVLPRFRPKSGAAR